MFECKTGYRVPKRVREKLRCPTMGCPGHSEAGHLKAGHWPTNDSPVLVRCLRCNIHIEVRNPRSFGYNTDNR